MVNVNRQNIRILEQNIITLYRGNMLRSSLLKALENPILTYFPYELDDDNFDKLSEETGWRYNR